MRYIKHFSLVSVFWCFSLSAQLEVLPTYLPTDELENLDDNDVIVKNFKETMFKLSWYTANAAETQIIYDMCQSYVYGAEAAILAIRNPSWENIKENFVLQLLPDYSDQGTYLETIYDKELMRDIDQYIDYMESVTTYGFNITALDKDIRTFLSPENDVANELEEQEGEIVEEALVDGVPISAYQQRLTQAFQSVQAYEPTGNPEVDDQATREILQIQLGTSEVGLRAVVLVDQMLREEWSDDAAANTALMQVYFDGFFAVLEEEEVMDVPDEPEAPIDGNDENPLANYLQSRGLEERNVVQRYGPIAQPFVDRYINANLAGNESAQRELTNVYNTWNDVMEATKYLDKAVELEQIAREIIENGVQYDTSELEELWGRMKNLWDQIRNVKSQ